MLQLLRKYQKAVFGVVAVFVIASFAFFGTQKSSGYTPPEKPDFILGKAIDGSQMHAREIEHLAKLLDSKNANLEGNFLNDRVIEDDMFSSGLGGVLITEYRTRLKQDFEERFEKFKRYKPYVHPQQLISAEGAWKMFAPELLNNYQKFKELEDPLADETVNTLISLYLNHIEFPETTLRQLLHYQQQQYSNWISPDPYLQSGDLNLFHAKSLSDWFGPNFLKIAAQFVHNSALFAAEKGYQVSYEEARASLLQVGLKKLQALDRNRQIAAEDLSRAFGRQLGMFGMDEKEAVLAWQKVLLFRKIFQDVGCSIFVDSLTAKDLYEKASEKLSIDLYSLDKNLQLSGKEEAIKLETYLELVGKSYKENGLPTPLYTQKEIKSRCPALLQKRFLVELAKVDKNAIASDIALRRMYEWQVTDSGWEKLETQFPKLAKLEKDSTESRFASLKDLKQEEREKIDHFSRLQIISDKPELIREHLAGAETEKQVLKLGREKGLDAPSGIHDPYALSKLLKKSFFAEGKDAQDATENLSCFTQDGKNFYRLKVLDATEDWEITTFREALERGALEEPFKEKLRHFQKENGVKGDFAEVKEDLVQRYFDRAVQKAELEKASEERQRYFSINQWLLNLKERAENGDSAIFAKSPHKEYEDGNLAKRVPPENQFFLKRDFVTIGQEKKHPLKTEEMAEMPEGSWSAVEHVPGYGVCFMQLKERVKDSDYVAKKMREERYLLGKEAKLSLMRRLIHEINEQEALHIASSENDGS